MRLEAECSSLSEPAGSSGYSVKMHGLQLPDVIQLACLSRSRQALRVTAGAEHGWLFFDAGRLRHARAGEATGLEAVVSLLRASGGRVESVSGHWEDAESIDMGPEALLLRAAQCVDELERDRRESTQVPRSDAGERLGLGLAGEQPESDPTPSLRLCGEELCDEGLSREENAATRDAGEPSHRPSALTVLRPVSGESGLLERPADAPTLLGLADDPRWSALASKRPGIAPSPEKDALSRLSVTQMSEQGELQRMRGVPEPGLADVAFYTHQLGEAVGEALGLGPCSVVHLRSKERGLVVFKGQSIVGTAGRPEDLRYVLDKVGLA